VVESPLDAFRIGADVRGMQQDVIESNAKYRKTNEHILLGVAAWSAYRKFCSTGSKGIRTAAGPFSL